MYVSTPPRIDPTLLAQGEPLGLVTAYITSFVPGHYMYTTCTTTWCPQYKHTYPSGQVTQIQNPHEGTKTVNLYVFLYTSHVWHTRTTTLSHRAKIEKEKRERLVSKEEEDKYKRGKTMKNGGKLKKE
jgi:hypothetical protein